MGDDDGFAPGCAAGVGGNSGGGERDDEKATGQEKRDLVTHHLVCFLDPFCF